MNRTQKYTSDDEMVPHLSQHLLKPHMPFVLTHERTHARKHGPWAPEHNHHSNGHQSDTNNKQLHINVQQPTHKNWMEVHVGFSTQIDTRNAIYAYLEK